MTVTDYATSDGAETYISDAHVGPQWPDSFYCSTEHGTTKLNGQRLIYTLPMEPSSIELPDYSRTVEVFHDVKFYIPNDQKIYVPIRRHSLPFFDAFFYVLAPGRQVSLWFVQFTTATRPGGSAAAAYTVTTLRQNAIDAGFNVSVKYLLVIPKRMGVPAARKIPAVSMKGLPWETGKPEVYVQ